MADQEDQQVDDELKSPKEGNLNFKLKVLKLNFK